MLPLQAHQKPGFVPVHKRMGKEAKELGRLPLADRHKLTTAVFRGVDWGNVGPEAKEYLPPERKALAPEEQHKSAAAVFCDVAWTGIRVRPPTASQSARSVHKTLATFHWE
jgi:hypothetical protein